MKKLRYQWQRYWIRPGGTISFTDNGFLEDPTGRFGKYISADLATITDFKEFGCLILLGEPGIGKSTEIDELYQSTLEEVGKEHTLWINLKNVMTADSFIQLLTGDARFKLWAEKNEPLYLFLDSFDEGTFSMPRFVNYFSDLLTQHRGNINNLHLRVSCRTAMWPSYLEGSLAVLWSEANCRKYELCPLTRRDVEVALDAQGIDKQGFLLEVHNKGVAGLAGKPLTLNFLMDVFSENGGKLPARKSDIYLKGCELLAQEPDDSKRINPSVKPRLNLPQKMAIVERIAIATLIGGKPTVVIENENKLLDGEIGITELHGREIIDDVPVVLGDEEIKEVLNTGLFSSRGDGKVGWAHQTYGEYLAARYFIRHNLPWQQVKSFLFQDPLKIGIFQVVPQLYEVSAWLASLDPSFFDNAVLLDPEFLLLSDANVITDKQKKALTAQLLIRLDRGELVDRWETFNDTNYKKLNHPDIASQLETYIKDKNKGIVVRRAAIDIVRACKVISLEKLLVKTALDDGDNLSIRVHASLTIAYIGSEQFRKALKPLADGGFPDDPEDELKGAVLRALWPKHINGQEIFSLITYPKKRSFHGAYYSFVTKEFAQSLRKEDVLQALVWVAENALDPDRLEYFMGTLSDAIMLKAWEEISTPEVLEKFAYISYERLKGFAGIVGDRALSKEVATKFQEALDVQDQGRRALIKRLVQMVNEKDKSQGRKAFILYHRSHMSLINSKDLEWLVEWLGDEENNDIQKIIAEIIVSTFDVSNTQHIDLIYNARQENSALEEESRFWFEPVELASESAKEQRKFWIDQQKWEEKRERDEKEEILKVLSVDRINELLKKSEDGDLDSWWLLHINLCMYRNEVEDDDIRELPGWKIIDEETKERIIKCGKTFLQKMDASPDKWLGKGKIYYPALAGYRAIKFFWREEQEYIKRQDSEFWKRWASITLGFPLVSNEPENGKIVALAYKYAPDEVIETLNVLIDDEAERYNGLFINHLLDDCMDDRMRKFLIEKAKQAGFNPKASGEILRFLLHHNDVSAKDYIKSKIRVPLPEGEDDKEEVLSAAASLLQNVNRVDWEFLWDLILRDNEFGRALVFKAYDSPYHSSRVNQEISESQLADLYIWLTKEFPPEEYYYPEGGGSVTPQMSIGDWRDSTLRALMEKGTAEACRQIERVALAFPQYRWIKQYTLIEARRIATQKSWQPPQLDQLFKLVGNHDLRLVDSPDELMDIVLDALQKLDNKFQRGEHPAAINLWNEVRNKDNIIMLRPKDENRLSDYVKNYLEEILKDRGIIVNREVEIKRGNKTDIHISVYGRDHLGRPIGEAMKVTIETKGCWSDELDTAMEQQLVGQYLSPDTCRNGIYLVGWFLCDGWDLSDTRKKKAKKMTIEEVKKKFVKQAQDVSLATNFRVEPVVLDVRLS